MRTAHLFCAAMIILAAGRIQAATTNNVALFGQPSSNRPLWGGGNISGLTDGNTGNVFHLDQTSDPGSAYTIDLVKEYEILQIKIYPRQDACCPERLTNFRVSLHKDDAGKPGAEVWGTDLFADGSNPGSTKGTIVDIVLPTPQKGRWVQIRSMDDPVPAYGLQMTEAEVYARVDTASMTITAQPADAAAGVGKTATFSVSVGVLGDDPAKLTYQWQKNGANIAGATAASYTTPPVFFEEDKAKFRCVIKFPALPDLTSAEATLRVNLALQANATSNRPLWAGAPAWTVAMIVDGNRNGTIHGDTGIEAGMAFEIDLGAAFKFEEIDIFPRQDGCCPERLANIRVSVHNTKAGAIGDAVWSADLFTGEGENAGSGAGKVVKIAADLNAAGKFEGQFLRILALSDPVPDYFMQMNEVEIYGAPLPGATLLQINQGPADVITAPGHTASFSIGWRLINGDPSKVTFQWLRNGAKIAGATAETYTTPPLGFDGNTGVYRCVASYPGIPDVSSTEAKITFDDNYARNQPASSSGPLWGPGNWNISAIVDGNRSGVIHGDTTPPLGFKYEVDLGLEVEVDKIDIYPRQDGCCPDRLANIRVSLHQNDAGKAGAENWHIDLFTAEGENAGSGADTLVTISKGEGTGTFKGQWLRIQALDNPVKDYFLQMTEVEVHGKVTTIPQPAPILTYKFEGGKLILTYEAGSLESSLEVTGPWTGVATPSPYSVTTDQARSFFRAVRK